MIGYEKERKWNHGREDYSSSPKIDGLETIIVIVIIIAQLKLHFPERKARVKWSRAQLVKARLISAILIFISTDLVRIIIRINFYQFPKPQSIALASVLRKAKGAGKPAIYDVLRTSIINNYYLVLTISSSA